MAERDASKPDGRPAAVSPVRVRARAPRRGGPSAAATKLFWPGIDDYQTVSVFGLAFRLLQTEWWTPDRLERLHLDLAAALIRFAQASVPFYRQRLADVLAGARQGLTAEAFASIPILTRADVQAAGTSLAAARVPEGHGRVFNVHTSGSTGQAVHVKTTRLAHHMNAATTLRGHQWFRRNLAASNVTIKVTGKVPERHAERAWAPGGSGPAGVYSNRAPARQLFDWLRRDDPVYLQCHPSVLQELIYCSRELAARPNRLREVRTMGEVLEPALRALCRQQWGVPVRDNYSCEELGTLALECPAHEHLHVQSERLIVEVLDDDDRPCAPGAAGRIVVTGLFNYATPLIRYELGDRAIAGAPCPCGRGLPVLERIIGRERHPVLLPSGQRLFPVLDAEPLLLRAGVRQYQLVQRSLEEIDIKLVAGRRLAAAEETEIARHLQRNFRYPFRFKFVYVEAIERGPGGKFQLFRSELA